MRILYHGSSLRLHAPQFGFGKRTNDYGLGFYCTENAELAKEWAVGKDHDGWANRYQIDYWLRKEQRDTQARNEYLNALRKRRVPGDLRIDRIIDEGIRSDDPRLQ